MIRVIADVGERTGLTLERDDARSYTITYTEDCERAQIQVFLQALTIYVERNEKYHDNWKRMGWRGTLVRLRERAERLWDSYWNADDLGDLEDKMYVPRDVDDALDLINFAAFFIRGMNGRETTRDGSWWS